MVASQKTLVVIGRGLAGNLAALALSNSLGPSWRIVQVGQPSTPPEDSFYGNVTAPTAYNFLRSVGLDEPRLLRRSSTAFSLGTHFKNWLGGASWMQCHHSPFATPAGAPLHHQLTRLGLDLEPLLVSAQVALAGRFAHPPSDPGSVLSRAEYGYQFDPMEWACLLDQSLQSSPVEIVECGVSEVETQAGNITALTLENGDTLTATLVIDANGPSRRESLCSGGAFTTKRTVHAQANQTSTPQTGPACQSVEASAQGWVSTAFLQDRALGLNVSAVRGNNAEQQGFNIALGQLDAAWNGNCVAIGHAAAVVEPLTPAPMMLLQRDIERLLGLIPTGVNMEVERREYNRQYRDDIAHISLFLTTLVKSDDVPDSVYWRDAQPTEPDEKLQRKLAQFEHRGLLVSYDLEPFNDEDWTILHWGKGLRPRQYDRTADAMSQVDATQTLASIRQSIEQITPRIPPHGLYVAKLKDYLERQAHG
ncbi:tryptophan 7-halogenase [Maricaulaceae bacterium EIL42A08]|nr:tryptophan 7-halogenase [Maricaulaceae bacterium EIL42A08]